MPELLIHLLLPAAALIIAGFDRKLVLIFCPIAILPDFDIFFGIHRSFMHSLFFLGAICAILLLYTIYYKPQWKTHAIIISILLLSHPILDFFTAPVQLFWPIQSYFWLRIDPPTLDFATLAIDFGAFVIALLILTPEAAGGILEPTEPLGLFSNEGLLFLLLMGIAVMYWLIHSRKLGKLQPQPTINPEEGYA